MSNAAVTQTLATAPADTGAYVSHSRTWNTLRRTRPDDFCCPSATAVDLRNSCQCTNESPASVRTGFHSGDSKECVRLGPADSPGSEVLRGLAIEQRAGIAYGTGSCLATEARSNYHDLKKTLLNLHLGWQSAETPKCCSIAGGWRTCSWSRRVRHSCSRLSSDERYCLRVGLR